MKKRILMFVISFAVVFCLIPSRVFASSSIDTWDGTADTSWYDETKAEFEISTAEQLAGLAILVNGTVDNNRNDWHGFVGKTIKLVSDLDLSGHEWISIGSGANSPQYAFGGIFDGQNHIINGLYSHEDYISSDPNKEVTNTIRTGLFGGVHKGTIKNVGVTNADIYISEKDTSTYGMGIIVDWFDNSNMYNCYSSGNITGGSYVEKYIGGLIGFGTGNVIIQGCYSQANITGNYVGACYEESGADPLSWWDSLGGIIGASYSSPSKINDCWFDGKIIVNSIQAPVGGIIGYSENAEISNCMVATTEIGDDGYENTFWVAYEVINTITDCIYPNDDKYGTNPANYPDETTEIPAGTPTLNFNDDNILEKLNANASNGITWVKGINHPTFTNDKFNISANYDEVNKAIEKAKEYDSNLYKNYDVVQAAINAVIVGKNVKEQKTVDAYATAIKDAIAYLKYKDADYSKVNEAIAKAEALKKDNYKDFSKVQEALGAIIEGKNITEQITVDGYTTAIEEAISKLELKDADYTKVDALIKEVEALKKDDYKDFSKVEAAVNVVVRNKDITDQKVVDDYAKAIEDAINLLIKKEYYPPVITKPNGGIVETDNPNPQPGDTVIITAKPDKGMEIDKVLVLDKDGNEVTIVKNEDGTYSFIQPETGEVSIKVDYKKLTESVDTSDLTNIYMWSLFLLISGLSVVVIYRKKGHYKK